MTTTNFPNGVTSWGVPVIGSISGIPFTGTYFFVDPANGNDGNDGLSPQSAFATLYMAHSRMTSGNNDVCVFIGNGSTTGTARLSTALATSVTSSATTGTLNWTKSAAHMIGVTAPSGNAARARIAPPTGTYTQSTFGSGNFVVVSGSGCMFQNFSLFNGFSTGGTNQICWTDSGSRNYYSSVQFGGIADATSAADTGSTNLKLSGSESRFDNCVIGLDTVTRSAANASLIFASGAARHQFVGCVFPMETSSSGSLFVSAATAAIDRYQRFDDCLFINAVSSASTTISAAMNLGTAGSPDGCVVLQRCTAVGVTKWGVAGSLARIFVDGGPPTAGTTGLAVAAA